MKREFSVSRLILFIIGFLVLILLPSLLLPSIYFASWRGTAIIIIIELIYIGFVFPLVFKTIGIENADRVIIGGAIYYRGMLVFTIASIIAIVFTLKPGSSLKTVIAIELIGTIIAVVFAYLGVFSHRHIQNVSADEKIKKETLDSLKNSISQTKILLGSKFPADTEVLGTINSLCDEIRYLSPSYDIQAKELEQKMLINSESIRSTNFENDNKKEIMRLLQNIDLLCKQRKTIY